MNEHPTKEPKLLCAWREGCPNPSICNNDGAGYCQRLPRQKMTDTGIPVHVPVESQSSNEQFIEWVTGVVGQLDMNGFVDAKDRRMLEELTARLTVETRPVTSKQYLAPLPWRVGSDEEASGYWTDAAVILDATGGTVAVLTRGYEGDANNEGCPSYTNARTIVEAVNRSAIETDGCEALVRQWHAATLAMETTDIEAKLTAQRRVVDAERKLMAWANGSPEEPKEHLVKGLASAGSSAAVNPHDTVGGSAEPSGRPAEKASSPHVHVWREDPNMEDWAICNCGEVAEDWYCPTSPDHICHYNKGNHDSCDYCGKPEERK